LNLLEGWAGGMRKLGGQGRDRKVNQDFAGELCLFWTMCGA
jgi:hypothetical protein